MYFWFHLGFHHLKQIWVIGKEDKRRAFRDELHIYVNGPSIYCYTDFIGPKRISSCPGAESLSEFNILWISLVATGERNKELIWSIGRLVKYFCGEPIYPSNDLDSVGPMLTKMS